MAEGQKEQRKKGKKRSCSKNGGKKAFKKQFEFFQKNMIWEKKKQEKIEKLRKIKEE